MPTQPASGYQIFSVWSGIMGFERAVLMGQVEHDLLIAIRKPKREKQRWALASLDRPRHVLPATCWKSHRVHFSRRCLMARYEYLHVLTRKDHVSRLFFSLRENISCSLILVSVAPDKTLFQLIITVELQMFSIVQHKYSTNDSKQ